MCVCGVRSASVVVKYVTGSDVVVVWCQLGVVECGANVDVWEASVNAECGIK